MHRALLILVAILLVTAPEASAQLATRSFGKDIPTHPGDDSKFQVLAVCDTRTLETRWRVSASSGVWSHSGGTRTESNFLKEDDRFSMEWWSGGGYGQSQTHGSAVLGFDALKEIGYQWVRGDAPKWVMRSFVYVPEATYTGAHPNAVAKDAYRREVPLHWKVSYRVGDLVGVQEHSFRLEWNALQTVCGGWDFVPVAGMEVSAAQLERARALVRLLQGILGVPGSE